MKSVGHLKTNDTSNIEMFTCASKSGSIHFSDECLHLISHKYWMNGLKGWNENE